jgi:membrane protease YdiL (CAAX protease family)
VGGAGDARAETSRLRRCVEAVALVAVLIAIGEIFDPSITTYVLLTIPATALFQLLVARRRLEDLWVREGPRLERRTIHLAIALPLAVMPLVTLVTGELEADDVIYLLAAVGGGFIASYALGQANRRTLRYFGLCMATAGLLGTLLLASSDIADAIDDIAGGTAAQPTGLSDKDLLLFAQQWLIIFPVAFLMEEVTFRGAVDSHVQRPGERYGFASAIFVSLLWALWHLPTMPSSFSLGEALVAVLPLQMLVGPFLSLYWRRSGNLAVTAGTHSFLDSVRNALGEVP